jgi:hypothetical protein
VALREVEVKRQTPLHAVLKPAAIAHDEFFEWNPALERDLKALPVGYRIKLPAQKVDAFSLAERRAWDAASKKPRTVKARAAAPKPPRQTAARSSRKSVATSAAKASTPAVRRTPIKAGL